VADPPALQAARAASEALARDGPEARAALRVALWTAAALCDARAAAHREAGVGGCGYLAAGAEGCADAIRALIVSFGGPPPARAGSGEEPNMTTEEKAAVVAAVRTLVLARGRRGHSGLAREGEAVGGEAVPGRPDVATAAPGGRGRSRPTAPR
jgi:hypothetical protein